MDKDKLIIGDIHLFFNKEKKQYNLGRLTDIKRGYITETHLCFDDTSESLLYQMNSNSYYPSCVALSEKLYSQINEFAYLNIIK